MSPRRIPTVIDDHLVTNTGEAHAIAVGSRGWFAWLCQETPSSFSYQTPDGAITIRPEKKRQGWYWYAYHATQGSLRKSYLGKADAMTAERLRLVAATLTQQPQTGAPEPSSGVRMTFLGAPRLTRADREITLTSMKALGLLAYLGVHGRPQRREHLLALLWPESPVAQARKNLRNLLWSIRDTLGQEVVIGHESLALGAHVSVDIGRFSLAQREARQREAGGESAFECYQTMIALYQGSFLDGVAINDAAEFETWVAMTREHFHEAHAHALRALAANYRAEGRWADVITLARTAVMADILQEPMYRMLMEAHARMGDRASALRQYETLRATLERELGVAPLAETEQLRRDILDGRLQPVPTDSSASSPPARSGSQQSTAPFIGRDSEMAALDDLWATAQQGRALAALIAGEAGQGKSRLWQMWSARLAPAATVLEAQCLSTTQSLPFAPVADLLRSPLMRRRLLRLAHAAPVWLEDVMQLVPDLRDELPVPLPSTILPPLEEQRRLFEALVQSLGIRAEHPLVLFVDNLHWADQATIEWLGYLLHRGHNLPLLFVGAYRPEEAPPPLLALVASWMRDGVGQRLALARLDREETTQLIAALNGDVRRAEELYARSAGNPYFLIELLRAEPGAMPAQLADLITLRLDQLPGAARQILQVAALIQPEIDCTLLQHISGRTEEETIEAVETLQQTGLLRDEGQRYAFGHPLIADVVGAEMSRARRTILHRRVAETLERLAGERLTEISGRLAHHFREAENPERAAYYAEVAGDRALALAAPVEAAQFYEQALALQVTALRYYRLGLARRRQADLEGARAAYIQALRACEQANEWSWASRICLEMARICLARNQFEDIVTWVERARGYLPYDEDPVLPHVLSAYLMGGHLRGTGQSLEAAIAQLNEALLGAIKGNMVELLPGILLELGTVVAHTGESTSAIRCFNELIAIAHTIGDYFHEALGYHNLAATALQVGDLPMARNAIEAGMRLARSRAVYLVNQWLFATRGELAMAERRWREAETWFARGLAEAERHDNIVQSAHIQANMGLVAFERGEVDHAITLLETTHTRLTRESARYLLITIDLRLIEIEVKVGRQDVAKLILNRAQDLLRGSDYAALHGWADRLRSLLCP
ncbi:MAG TPA: AAA family ATPase [Ktedonobacterales bacterium]